ncbi:hypothetical protein K501DRAFT_279456 [Backusella circina FSU 941]|nr:hypothetical protein K501DRAFT_279456 [Backusella circina FSU 941]
MLLSVRLRIGQILVCLFLLKLKYNVHLDRASFSLRLRLAIITLGSIRSDKRLYVQWMHIRFIGIITVIDINLKSGKSTVKDGPPLGLPAEYFFCFNIHDEDEDMNIPVIEEEYNLNLYDVAAKEWKEYDPYNTEHLVEKKM